MNDGHWQEVLSPAELETWVVRQMHGDDAVSDEELAEIEERARADAAEDSDEWRHWYHLGIEGGLR
jgi:hypothetical protein